MFFILNTLADQGNIYYAPVVPKIDCIKPVGRGVGAKLTVDYEKVPDCICRDGKDSFRHGLIVNLEVVESLLRRKFKGISYQRLEEKGWQIM